MDSKPYEFQYGFEFIKDDIGLEQGIVVACASSDTVDRQNDMIPFDVMKATFEKYFPIMSVRFMHQPKPVGKLLKWWAEEDTHRVMVEILLSKSRDGQDALTQIKEGIIRGLSIGGRAIDWIYKGAVRVIQKLTLTEVSLCDVPANPSALITLLKFDAMVTDGQAAGNVTGNAVTQELGVNPPGQVSQLSQHGVQELDPGPATVAGLMVGRAVSQIMKDWDENAHIRNVGKFAGKGVLGKLAAHPGPAAHDRAIQPVSTDPNVQKAATDPEAVLVRRGKVVGIARKEGEPLTPKKGFPEDWSKYGDPANWGWPCDEAGRCTSALGYYNGKKGKDGYSPREWAVLGRRIARLSSACLGKTYTFDPKDQSINSKEKKAMLMDKSAYEFLKSWDPEAINKDWDEAAHPRGPDGKFGDGGGGNDKPAGMGHLMDRQPGPERSFMHEVYGQNKPTDEQREKLRIQNMGPNQKARLAAEAESNKERFAREHPAKAKIAERQQRMATAPTVLRQGPFVDSEASPANHDQAVKPIN